MVSPIPHTHHAHPPRSHPIPQIASAMAEAVATPRAARAAKRGRVQEADQVLLCKPVPDEPGVYCVSSRDHGVLIALQNGDEFFVNLPCCVYLSWAKRQMCPLANTYVSSVSSAQREAARALVVGNRSRCQFGRFVTPLTQAAPSLCSHRGSPSRLSP